MMNFEAGFGETGGQSVHVEKGHSTMNESTQALLLLSS
jgi:hypothetical protein